MAAPGLSDAAKHGAQMGDGKNKAWRRVKKARVKGRMV